MPGLQQALKRMNTCVSERRKSSYAAQHSVGRAWSPLGGAEEPNQHTSPGRGRGRRVQGHGRKPVTERREDSVERMRHPVAWG